MQAGYRAAIEEDGTAIGGALESLGKSAAELGVTVDHFWINRSAHAFFIVMDAPPSHEDVEPFVQVAHLIAAAGLRNFHAGVRAGWDLNADPSLEL